jgi:hypothetical protein
MVIFDLGNYLENKLSLEKNDFHYNSLQSKEILNDISELEATIKDSKLGILALPLTLNIESDDLLLKQRTQLTTILDSGIYLELERLIIISNFTPYYGIKTAIDENSLRQSRNLDAYSLHLHLIREEIARARLEGLNIIHFMSGFHDVLGVQKTNEVTKNWNQIVENELTFLIKKLMVCIKNTAIKNENFISISKVTNTKNHPHLGKISGGILNKIFSLFSRRYYENDAEVVINDHYTNQYFN